jgi:UDP-N-acetyl-D-glucosamine dehydrogenase
MSTLIEKIVNRQARVGVVGVGYVGLPLAVALARAGYQAVGIDYDRRKMQALAAGKSYIKDLTDSDLQPLVADGRLQATTEFSALAECDAVCICVPTPLGKTKDPDVTALLEVGDKLAKYFHPGMVVILESTTYPGFTREVYLPKLEATGLKCGKDFFLAFSPERVDPGNARWQTKNTPKIVGGHTPECLRVAQLLYQQVMERIVPVTSTDAAEMAKLLENTFRAVNIGLVNEVAIMCSKLGLDTWEVIDAAATKPFGFMPFYPGPGLGGHCIPVDPHYLSWKLKTLKYNARFIELAGEINSNMPNHVVEMTSHVLNDHGKAVRGSKIFVLGVAYKKDSEDLRESPALDILELLEERGAELAYHDPHVPTVQLPNREFHSQPLDNLGHHDAVLIITDHSGLDYSRVVREAKVVLDTRNATRGIRAEKGRIVKL